jgi:hypothetical protein
VPEAEPVTVYDVNLPDIQSRFTARPIPNDVNVIDTGIPITLILMWPRWRSLIRLRIGSML